MVAIYDYRVIRRRIGDIDTLHIHRVFYSDEEKKTPIMIETHPATVESTSAEVMADDLEMMANALHNPVIYVPEWNYSKGNI